MRSTYRVLAGLIALGVIVQAAAIAFGWFDVMSKVDDGSLVLDSDYEGNAGHAVHGIVGMTVMPVLGLLLLVTSFFTKRAGASTWAGGVFAAIVLQVLLAFVAFGAPIVGVLHGGNALVVFGLAVMAFQRASVRAVAGASHVIPAQAAAPSGAPSEPAAPHHG